LGTQHTAARARTPGIADGVPVERLQMGHLARPALPRSSSPAAVSFRYTQCCTLLQ
jgi:hypothetical protein